MSIINLKGFSLLETSISLGLMGGVVLVTFMKVSKKQAANEYYVKAKGEIQKEISLLATSMKNSENCRYFLSGIDDPEDSAETEINELKAPPQKNRHEYRSSSNPEHQERKIMFKSNEKKKFYKTQKIALKRDENLNSRGVRNLEFIFRIKNKNNSLWGRSDDDQDDDLIITEKIPLIISSNSSGQVSDCYSPEGENRAKAKKSLCAQLGPMVEWSEANQKCQFKHYECPAGKVPKQVKGLGTYSEGCVPAENVLKIDDLFVTGVDCEISANGVSLSTNSDGKITVCP